MLLSQVDGIPMPEKMNSVLYLETHNKAVGVNLCFSDRRRQNSQQGEWEEEFCAKPWRRASRAKTGKVSFQTVWSCDCTQKAIGGQSTKVRGQQITASWGACVQLSVLEIGGGQGSSITDPVMRWGLGLQTVLHMLLMCLQFLSSPALPLFWFMESWWTDWPGTSVLSLNRHGLRAVVSSFVNIAPYNHPFYYREL